MKNNSKIIAIASVSGGGKTAITNQLKQILPNSISLHFDDYIFDGDVRNYEEWMKNGADFNVWDLSPLKLDLDRLISNGKYQFIILDYPMAYKNDLIKPYIDFAIYIDTPLDVAMARRVLRDMLTIDEVRAEMDGYLRYARRAYQVTLDVIRPNSDFVVDGTQTIQKIAELIKTKVEKI